MTNRQVESGAADSGPDNLPVRMIRPHLRDLPQVPFPEGFTVRPMRADEGSLWEDLWRDAEPFQKIVPGLFLKEFGDDLAAIPERCFFIVTARGVAVGTIAAWYNRSLNGLAWGRIHWVATRPACQGRGLARAAMTFAMARLAQWHERAYLMTSSGRLGAIRIYLDFGFVPDLDTSDAAKAWRQVAQYLDHPALRVFKE